MGHNLWRWDHFLGRLIIIQGGVTGIITRVITRVIIGGVSVAMGYGRVTGSDTILY